MMMDFIIDVYKGICFWVEVVCQGDLYVGCFMLLDLVVGFVSGMDDSYWLMIQNVWVMFVEVLFYVIEVVYYVIEGILLFMD